MSKKLPAASPRLASDELGAADLLCLYWDATTRHRAHKRTITCCTTGTKHWSRSRALAQTRHCSLRAGPTVCCRSTVHSDDFSTYEATARRHAGRRLWAWSANGIHAQTNRRRNDGLYPLRRSLSPKPAKILAANGNSQGNGEGCDRLSKGRLVDIRQASNRPRSSCAQSEMDRPRRLTRKYDSSGAGPCSAPLCPRPERSGLAYPAAGHASGMSIVSLSALAPFASSPLSRPGRTT